MLARAAIVVVSFGALAAGCGSSDGSGSAVTAPVVTVAIASMPTTTTTTAEAQTGSIGDAIAVAVGAIDDSRAETCDIIRRTLETASEALYAMTGAFPTSQADLVEAQILREPSTEFDIAVDGTIVPVDGGPCVGH
jgi:hypothetical protein